MIYGLRFIYLFFLIFTKQQIMTISLSLQADMVNKIFYFLNEKIQIKVKHILYVTIFFSSRKRSPFRTAYERPIQTSAKNKLKVILCQNAKRNDPNTDRTEFCFGFFFFLDSRGNVRIFRERMRPTNVRHTNNAALNVFVYIVVFVSVPTICDFSMALCLAEECQLQMLPAHLQECARFLFTNCYGATDDVHIYEV